MEVRLESARNSDRGVRVVDLAAYRAARAQTREQLPLFDERPERLIPPGRTLSHGDVAHRQRMLGHLLSLEP